jgi:hypothetical protein
MNTEISDFRDFLPKGMTLTFRDWIHQPSIQLAVWCAAHLPLDPYVVRYRSEDDNFEIYTEGFGAAFVATWPDPGILGQPKMLTHRQWQPGEEPGVNMKKAEVMPAADSVMQAGIPEPQRGGVMAERSTAIAALDGGGESP